MSTPGHRSPPPDVVEETKRVAEAGVRYAKARAIPDFDATETYDTGAVVRMPDGTLSVLEAVPGAPPAWKPLRRVTVHG